MSILTGYVIAGHPHQHLVGGRRPSLRVPLTQAEVLTRPPVSIADGSPSPGIVRVNCLRSGLYRKTTVAIPVDPATAAAMIRTGTAARRYLTITVPLALVCGLAGVGLAWYAFAAVIGSDGDPQRLYPIVLAGILLAMIGSATLAVARSRSLRTRRPQHPELDGSGAVVLHDVHPEFIGWLRRNQPAETIEVF